MKTYLLVFSILILAANPATADSEPMDHQHEHEHDHDMSPSEHQNHFAVGEPAAQSESNYTVEVAMLDSMRYQFNPSLETIKSGDVVHFIVSNKDGIPHEFSIANQQEQRTHLEKMKTMPGIDHLEPNVIALQAGGSGTLTWRFTGNDVVVFACNIPGHFEAGMVHYAQIESE